MPGAPCLPAWRRVRLDATRFRPYQTLTYVGTEAGGRWDFHFSRAQCELFSTYLHTHTIRLHSDVTANPTGNHTGSRK